MWKTQRLSNTFFSIADLSIILIFCAIPLFVDLPYKINLYLAWEGAYRMYLGQTPFVDFGMPLGYGFWIIPALFFKIFGPFMSSLIKAQFFINLVSAISYRHILNVFKVQAPLRTLGVLLFSVSYIFINFWPWYNHVVFVYELAALALLVQALVRPSKHSWWQLLIAGILAFVAIFTKQDIGGLGFLVMVFLLIAHAMLEKKIKPLIFFAGGFIVAILLFILPLLSSNFTYWFNYGQDPHSSRIALMDFINEAFNFEVIPIRIYLFALLILLINKWKPVTAILKDTPATLFFLLTLGLLVQPLLGQVTTYIPMYVHYYFHSFALIYILAQIPWRIDLHHPAYIGVIVIALLFWFSQDTWRYGKRILYRITNYEEVIDYDEVSKRTWQLPPTDAPSSDRSDWKSTPFKSLDNVLMPSETIAGMNRLIEEYSKRDNLKVLNMSEVPQLAYEIGYEPLASPEQPLWYHRNVAIFDKQISFFCEQIESGEYDLVIFQDIPSLNGFFPPEVQACLKANYTIKDRFLAPRIPMDSFIEVYVPSESVR
jgi:hypothetical protein